MTLMMVITVLGWFGALAGLVAYAMVSRGRWSADSLAFQGTNVAAATILMTVAAANGVWPSAASNIVVLVIGGNALFTVVRARLRTSENRTSETRPALTVVENTAQEEPEPIAQPAAVGHRAYAEAA
jgi:cation transport ATPase